MDTSRVDGVKAPQHRGTPRSDLRLRHVLAEAPLDQVLDALDLRPGVGAGLALAGHGSLSRRACGSCFLSLGARQRRALVLCFFGAELDGLIFAAAASRGRVFGSRTGSGNVGRLLGTPIERCKPTRSVLRSRCLASIFIRAEKH